MLRVAQTLRPWVMALGLLGLSASASTAQGPLRDGFESPQVAWRPGEADVNYRLEVHERTPRAPHSGQVCEYVQLHTSAGGTHLYLNYDIGQAAVIAEFVPSVWVRADRASPQLFARVVLPRARHPQTGQVGVLLVPGTQCTRVGTWEPLRVEGLPLAVKRQARALRAQWRADVDESEAYVDRLQLNVYPGGGRIGIAIDDLELPGFVNPNIVLTSGTTTLPALPGTPTTVAEPLNIRAAELNGSVLIADGRPTLPRIIDHQGEPLSLLQQLGFNGVRLRSTPSAELLAEANERRMWVVCPPPKPAGLDDPQRLPEPLPELGAAWSSVLAWDFGSRLTGQELETTKRWTDAVRRSNRTLRRPLLCECETDLRAYSRYVDVLVLSRQPLCTSFELNDYGTWLRERPRLARPGTPIWTVIQTQPAPELIEQCAALSQGRAAASVVSIDQVRALTYSAIASGVRGLFFASHSRLDAQDPATRYRALGLELLNMELDWLEPWGASGSLVTTLPITQAPNPALALQRTPAQALSGPVLAELPDVRGALLQTDRARLVMPLWQGVGAQYVSGQMAVSTGAVVVPGTIETSDVYRFSAGGLAPVRHTRVTGGVRATLEEYGQTSLLLLTQDPVVVSGLMRRLTERGPRLALLQRELAQLEFERTTEVDSQLAAQGRQQSQVGRWMTAARDDLARADERLRAREYDTAYLNACRALRPLRVWQRAHWDAATKGVTTPVGTPLLTSFVTLSEAWVFNQQIASAQWAQNVLSEGNFENLDAMLRAGWQNFVHPHEGITALADLSPEVRDRRDGRTSLRLSARATDPAQAASTLVESPPVWITSPAVSVQPGQLVRISGWVNVPQSIVGSVEGVLVLDSIGGEALAERIGRTTSWRPFVLHRVATRGGPISVTIALTGLGQAWVDNIQIEPLALPGSAPFSPSVPPTAQLPAPSTTPAKPALIRLPWKTDGSAK